MMPMLNLMNGGTWHKLGSKKKCKKTLVAHRRDKATYRRHLSTFKKAFPNFIYCSSDSTKPFNPVFVVEEVECNGTIKDTHKEKPQKLRGGGQDILTKVFEEQT